MRSFLRYHVKDRIRLSYQRGHLLLSKEIPILVFTMAKVGSLSIYTSIKKTSNNPCFHIHSLNEKEIKKSNQQCFEANIFPDSRDPSRLINSKIIQKERPYMNISAFRNPIERMFSAFFEAFRIINGVEPHEYQGTSSDLIKTFNEWVNFDYTLKWYEKQFEKATGINVYNYPFNKDEKFLIIEEGQSKTLLLDSELNDEDKTKIIKEFTGIKQFQLTNVNVTSQSASSELYKDFKNNISLEKNQLDSVMDSIYFKHFFSNKTRDEILSKWGK